MSQASESIAAETLAASAPVQTSSVRTVFSNMMSLMASDVINRVTSFVIYALVGRYLGSFAFGQMSLALSMFYTFQVFAIAGLKILIVREIAKDRTQVDRYLVHGSIIVVFSTLISLALLWGFVNLMGYTDTITPEVFLSLANENSLGLYTTNLPANTAFIIMLTCLGLMPFALTAICEGVFQGLEKMTYIAYVNAPANILRIVLIIFLAVNGYGLAAIAIILFISHVLVMVAEWGLLLRYVTRPKLSFNFGFAVKILRQALTFLGIDAVIAVSATLYLVLLEAIINESAVGLYSSATQLLTPLIILYQSIVLAVFPVMCQRFDENNPSSMKRIAENLMELLLALAIPLTVGVFIYAEWGLVFVYSDPEFANAGNAMRLMVFITLMQALTSVLGRVLVANMLERITLRIVVINMALTVVFGLLLIPPFGIMGAALASFLAMSSDLIQHYVPVRRMFSGIPLLKLAWKSLLATGFMAAFLYVMRGQNELIAIVFAIAIYFGVLAALMVVTIGGPRQIKAKYIGVQAA